MPTRCLRSLLILTAALFWSPAAVRAVVPDPVPGAPPPPGSIGPILSGRFTELGDAARVESKAEWQRRLKARGGRASLVPLSPLDPSRDVLLLVPGNGMNFQDVHALRHLDDSYQAMVAISDHRRSIVDNGRHLAAAVEEFLSWRQAAAAAAVAPGGRTAGRALRIIGHSFGVATAQMMLGDLAERRRIGDDPGALADQVLFVAIDGPWRGADLPWMFTVPGIKQLGGWLLARLWPGRAGAGNQSLANRTKAMRTLTRLTLPASVRIHLVTVLGPMSTSPGMRHLEPVANWYSCELAPGELDRLWRFYRDGGRDMDVLQFWSPRLVTHRQGLLNLVLALARDEDYPAHASDLVAAARSCSTPEAFAGAYDRVLRDIVDTYHGQHTQFMWTDPLFMPRIRRLLAGLE
jgi:hypothetical protein